MVNKYVLYYKNIRMVTIMGTIMGTIICTMICTTIMGINKVIICTNIEWLYVNGINNRIANYNNLVDTLTY